MLNRVQIDEFEALARPLIKWINENGNPHSQIVIEPDSALLYSGEFEINTIEYIKD